MKSEIYLGWLKKGVTDPGGQDGRWILDGRRVRNVMGAFLIPNPDENIDELHSVGLRGRGGGCGVPGLCRAVLCCAFSA